MFAILHNFSSFFLFLFGFQCNTCTLLKILQNLQKYVKNTDKVPTQNKKKKKIKMTHDFIIQR